MHKHFVKSIIVDARDVHGEGGPQDAKRGISEGKAPPRENKREKEKLAREEKE